MYILYNTYYYTNIILERTTISKFATSSLSWKKYTPASACTPGIRALQTYVAVANCVSTHWRLIFVNFPECILHCNYDHVCTVRVH